MGGAGAVSSLVMILGTATLLGGLAACALVPSELNLSPLYHHRLDRDGSVREMDVIWPIFHYNKTEDGGSDFRIRPLYRHVTSGPGAGLSAGASEHQFLWPLGRVRNARGETLGRLFPLWRYAAREDDEGKRETDWEVVLLLWGGTRDDGKENYFSFLPFWADIPDFLTYDRFQAQLFPLHVRTEKDGVVSDQFLWPLIGFGGDGTDRRYWSRVLPIYSVAVDRQRYERYTALWPFVHWGYEGLYSDDPIQRFFLFPLYGRQTSQKVDAWTFLWPFFSKYEIKDRMLKLDVLWPIFRLYREDTEWQKVRQWWLWPLIGHTVTDDQRAWTFLWPLIWLREYDDPEGTTSQTWIIPLYWHMHRARLDGTEDSFTKVWPLYHGQSNHDGSGEWRSLSPWPWQGGNAYGVQENYGFLWTLAEREWTAASDSFALAANVFTTAQREGRRQTSVPFLFNWEADASGSTLRLFQFIPLHFGGSAAPAEPR